MVELQSETLRDIIIYLYIHILAFGLKNCLALVSGIYSGILPGIYFQKASGEGERVYTRTRYIASINFQHIHSDSLCDIDR